MNQKQQQTQELSGIELDLAVSSFIADLEMQDISRHTNITYRSVLQAYRGHLGSYPCNTDNATRYMAALRDQGKAKATLHLHNSVLHNFFQYIGLEFSYKVRPSRRLPAYTPIDAVRSVLAAISTRHDNFACRKERDYLIVLMLAYTGMRRSELTALKIRDIELQPGLINIRGGKGDKDRVVPLSKMLRGPLSKYLENRKPTDRLFAITPDMVWRLVKRYARIAGIANLHPHSFRHFFRHLPPGKGRDTESHIGVARAQLDPDYGYLFRCDSGTPEKDGGSA